MAIGDGDANAGWANLDRVIAEDFSGFKDHFQFFAGVAILFEAADLRDGIECDGVAEGFVFVVLVIERGTSSGQQISSALQSGTAGGLVGTDDNSSDSSGIVQRFECHDHLGCGAVGAGDDTGGGEGSLGVDFRDHESDIGMHPPVPGFVDNSAAGTDSGGQEFGGCVIRSAGDYEINAVEAVMCEFFDGEATAGEFQLLSGTACGGEESKISGRETTLFK